jgi:thioredoxin-like negative regulator of GroEL
VIEQLLQADRLLTVDMVDQAEAIYRRVREQDPRNAIAVVGLARCAVARNDDQAAYPLVAAALAIDPQNDYARRMEARLAETLAAQGVAVQRPPQASGPPPGIDFAVSGEQSIPVSPVPAEPSPESPKRSRSLVDRLLGR